MLLEKGDVGAHQGVFKNAIRKELVLFLRLLRREAAPEIGGVNNLAAAGIQALVLGDFRKNEIMHALERQARPTLVLVQVVIADLEKISAIVKNGNTANIVFHIFLSSKNESKNQSVTRIFPLRENNTPREGSRLAPVPNEERRDRRQRLPFGLSKITIKENVSCHLHDTGKGVHVRFPSFPCFQRLIAHALACAISNVLPATGGMHIENQTATPVYHIEPVSRLQLVSATGNRI
jgi:hypothetical protein